MSDPAVQELASMAEVLRHRAASIPDRRAFLQLGSDGAPGPEFTFAQLDRRAAAIAAVLVQHAGEGDRAILLFAPGLEFIPAIFGCLYAGVIAVPAWPPRPDRPWQGTGALARLAEDCGPRVLLTGGESAPLFRNQCRDLPALADVAWIDTTALPTGPRGWSRAAEDRRGISHLQYTSGSTGDPKGVVVAHANVMHNERVIAESSGHFATAAEGICGVNWLPFQHDFGLIGALFQSVYVGGPLVQISPLTILQRPFVWLEALSAYRGHTSAGPNFAYDLCIRRTTAEQRATLDLSGWKIASIGAEPVRAATLDEFSDAFAAAGFEPTAFRPGYGLAEATLAVAECGRESLPTVASLAFPRAESSMTAARGVRSVGCGAPQPGEILRIVDPATGTVCLEGAVGEIWFASDSVAQGYWNDPEATGATFRATLDECPGVHFLRTGDLGCLHNGELFVVGRLKEVIIVRGQNHYPEDIEESIRLSDPALEAGATVVFQTEGTESPQLVVLHEVGRHCRGFDAARLARRIRNVVAERRGIDVDDIVFVKHASLPKTTTGKRQRFACRERYEQHKLVSWQSKTSEHQSDA